MRHCRGPHPLSKQNPGPFAPLWTHWRTCAPPGNPPNKEWEPRRSLPNLNTVSQAVCQYQCEYHNSIKIYFLLLNNLLLLFAPAKSALYYVFSIFISHYHWWERGNLFDLCLWREEIPGNRICGTDRFLSTLPLNLFHDNMFNDNISFWRGRMETSVLSAAWEYHYLFNPSVSLPIPSVDKQSSTRGINGRAIN